MQIMWILDPVGILMIILAAQPRPHAHHGCAPKGRAAKWSSTHEMLPAVRHRVQGAGAGGGRQRVGVLK